MLQMADNADQAGELIDREEASMIFIAQQHAARMSKGYAGECASCEEHSMRLVHGHCAKCRDKYDLP